MERSDWCNLQAVNPVSERSPRRPDGRRSCSGVNGRVSMLQYVREGGVLRMYMCYRCRRRARGTRRPADGREVGARSSDPKLLSARLSVLPTRKRPEQSGTPSFSLKNVWVKPPPPPPLLLSIPGIDVWLMFDRMWKKGFWIRESLAPVPGF